MYTKQILLLQLRVTAVDDAEPGRMATADVTILVQRNANAPKFGRENYRATVSDTATLGEPIINITATDDDGVSNLLDILAANKTTVNTFL